MASRGKGKQRRDEPPRNHTESQHDRRRPNPANAPPPPPHQDQATQDECLLATIEAVVRGHQAQDRAAANAAIASLNLALPVPLMGFRDWAPVPTSPTPPRNRHRSAQQRTGPQLSSSSPFSRPAAAAASAGRWQQGPGASRATAASATTALPDGVAGLRRGPPVQMAPPTAKWGINPLLTTVALTPTASPDPSTMFPGQHPQPQPQQQQQQPPLYGEEDVLHAPAGLWAAGQVQSSELRDAHESAPQRGPDAPPHQPSCSAAAADAQPAPAKIKRPQARPGKGSGPAKSFVCPECSKAFQWSGNLVRHRRVHSGAKPYPCDYCGMRFNNSTNCKTHARKCRQRLSKP